MIAKESSLPRGLPKKTESLCPECRKIIIATMSEKDGKVVMDKECPEHGHFSDVIWSDVEMYLKSESLSYDGVGVENPFIHRPRSALTTAVSATCTLAIPRWPIWTLPTAAT